MKVLAAYKNWFLALFCAVLPWASDVTAAASPVEFTLSQRCPSSLQLRADGRCEIVSLYQLYNSATGFGGLRVPLPKAKDGYRPAQIDLGRYLFFDPLLSADKTTSCAHCHHPDLGFSDARARAAGVGAEGWGAQRHGGITLERASPSLWNMAFLPHYFWDGREDTLEAQAHGPLFNPDEMNNTPERLLIDLNSNDTYRNLFRQAYPEQASRPVTVAMVASALAAFQSSLVSLNSRYDRYAHGDQSALNAQEIQGHNLFRSFVTRCSQCHTPPLFSNGQIAVIGAPEPAGKSFDTGVYGVSGAIEWKGGFKVPSLRNISRTAPYMHSGVFKDLASVIDFYNNKRGHAVPKGQDLKIHWHIAIQEKTLSDQETQALVAFLITLDDETNKPMTPNYVPSGLNVVGQITNINSKEP